MRRQSKRKPDRTTRQPSQREHQSAVDAAVRRLRKALGGLDGGNRNDTTKR